MFPVLMAIGGLGLAAQVVILRELIAAFAGNEVSSGIFLAGWLVCEGLGAWVFGRLVGKFWGREWSWLYGVALVSALSSAGAVLGVTFLRSLLGFLPGESLDIGALFAVTFLVVILPAGTHGGLFALSAAIISRFLEKTAVGRTYLYEGLGTVLAAVICYFGLLSRMCGLGIVAVFGGILLIILPLFSCYQWEMKRLPTSVFHLPSHGQRSRITVFWLLVFLAVGGALFALVPSVAGELERMVWEKIWPGQKVLKVKDSPYGKVVTMEREGQRLLLYNGVTVLAVPQTDIVSLEELIHFPLLSHPEPKRVLIFAGGMGGAVKEVLKHPVEQVVVVELDSALVNEIRRCGGSLIAEELDDPRVELIISDPRRFLMVTQDSFDIVLLMSGAPHNLSSNRLFSKESFSWVERRLRKGGFFVTRTVGAGETPTPEAINLLRTRQATLAQVFLQVKTFVLDFPLIVAGNDSFTFSLPELLTRLEERKLNLSFLRPDYLAALLNDFRQSLVLGSKSSEVRTMSPELRGQRADGGEIGINTDLKPREVFLNMLREHRRSSPFFSRLYSLTPRVTGWGVLIFLLVLLIAGVVGGLTRDGDFARGMGIWTSGFAGAGISTLAILTYQVRFGSVYSGVALLLAGFMFGTVPGAWLGTALNIGKGKRQNCALRSKFISGEVALMFLAGVLILLARYGYGQASFLILLILTGMCLGWQFALAGKFPKAVGGEWAFLSAGTVAGRLSILDFTGGAVGGVVIAVIIAPWFGLISAAMLLGGVKFISLITQFVSMRQSP